MPQGPGTYGSKVGRPPKKKKMPNEKNGKSTKPINSMAKSTPRKSGRR